MRRFVSMITLLMLFLLLIFSVYKLGAVGVQEFSPNTLEIRYHQEYRIPVLEYTIICNDWEYSIHKNMKELISNSYIQPQKDNGFWVTVYSSHSAFVTDGVSDFYKELMKPNCSYLGWTNRNPQVARLVWQEFIGIIRSSPEKPDEAIANGIRFLKYAVIYNDTESFQEWYKNVKPVFYNGRAK